MTRDGCRSQDDQQRPLSEGEDGGKLQVLRRLETQGPGCLGVCVGGQTAEGGQAHSPSQPCICWGSAWLLQSQVLRAGDRRGWLWARDPLTPSHRAPLSGLRGSKQLQHKETLIHGPEGRLLPRSPGKGTPLCSVLLLSTLIITLDEAARLPATLKAGHVVPPHLISDAARPPNPTRCDPCPSHSVFQPHQ